MITMSMGLFTATVVIFFLGGGAVRWLLRGLRKDKCKCDVIGDDRRITDDFWRDLSHILKEDIGD